MTLKNLLYDAMTDHVRCKTCLNQAMETGTCSPPSSVIREDTMCEFGKWLYSSDISSDILTSAHYTNILSIHADFHIAAAEVMKTIESGKIEQAQKMILDDGHYTVHASKLRNEFLSWVEELD
jgi:Chemoreceptor zinc-binding domain